MHAINNESLLQKYNKAGPRYTSYPALPHWKGVPDKSDWFEELKHSVATGRAIELYLHIPFCESLCTYCGCHKKITKNHELEENYITALLGEWDLYIKELDELPKIAAIHLGGGTPNFLSAKNIKRLINGITSKAKLLKNHSLSIEIDPRTIKVEQLKMLRELKFDRISLGIQDFDPDVQKAINRVQDFKMISELVLTCRNFGFKAINFDLIYGLPLQNKKSIQKTIKKVLELAPERIALYSYAHVPWKALSQKSLEKYPLPLGREKQELFELSEELLEKAGYLKLGLDHFSKENDPLNQAFKNGQLHRNFMGYTVQESPTLIGLGASSISSSGNGFVQNEKDIEKYQENIQEGAFPWINGHTSTLLDVKTNQVIQGIMCNLSSETYDFILNLEKDLQEKVRKNLLELIEDGLINMSGSKISVTERGRPFLRNICMAIDPRLIEKGITDHCFSKSI